MQKNRLERLAVVTPWYGEFAGGAESAARGFAENLVLAGVEVEVLTTCCKSPYDDWWQDSLPEGVLHRNGVAVRRFPVNRHGREKYETSVVNQLSGQVLDLEDKYNFFIYGICSDALVEYVRKMPEDVPVVVLPYFQALAFRLIQRLPRRITMIPCFHDEPQFYWEPVRDMMQNVKDVLFLSEEEKTLAIRNYGLTIGRKIVESMVVGVGVELSPGLFSYAERELFQGQELPLTKEMPRDYFLYVGRKEVGKGVAELVQWYRIYLDRQRKSGQEYCTLVFIGGGDSSLVPHETGFLDFGFVSESEKSELMRNAKGLINLSKNESFSLVIMEAWLYSKPVIVSAHCAVTAGHCKRANGGLAVDNLEELHAALLLLSGRPDVGQSLGSQGNRYVRNNYRWRDVLNRLILGLSESGPEQVVVL